jgi:alpha-beta hydrolase superfamily lysophospholipase
MPSEPASAAIATFTASDGYVWHYRRHAADGPARAIVVCVHGIQSHSGWYCLSSAKLSEAAFDVFFLDRRGSGLNQAARGDTPSFTRLLDDVAEFLRSPLVLGPGQKPSLPVFQAAISWGGKLAVALQRRHPGLVDGLVLLCPGFFPQVRVPWATRLAVLAARLVSPERLFAIPLNDPELFTASPHWRDFIRNDPLALHQATARLLVESVRLDRYLRGAARCVTVPTLLLLAGKDCIIRNDKTHRYFHRFATTDKQVITYPEAHHTLEFEPDPNRFIAELTRWLERRCVASPPRPSP